MRPIKNWRRPIICVKRPSENWRQPTSIVRRPFWSKKPTIIISVMKPNGSGGNVGTNRSIRLIM
jgi:hypothetical protein